MITNKNTREYEVQLWTLQDSFITVLKSFNIDNFGTIEEPHLELNDDSEDRFTFRLPMYIQNGNEFVENPIWYNVRNGNLIVNLRKIKVIFYRGTEKQRIFEFVITRITESHEGFEKTCEVECEGLAFNELGKTGYNIDLSQELYELDCENGYKQEEFQTIDSDSFVLKQKTTEVKEIKLIYNPDSENNSIEVIPDSIEYNEYNYQATVYLPEDASAGEYKIIYTYVPLNNINYWLEKVFPSNSIWQCDIRMNWNDYYGEDRESNIIYEDAYIENWEFNEDNTALIPTNVVDAKEKCRIVTESASNRYNLTQSIAETFGVFCRYIYEYDDNLNIINRTVEFYNNNVQEEKEITDFTYYYDTESISRELDSAEQISKMYVLSSSNEDMITSSITEIDANKSLESYLLNFDYLLETGAIDEEQSEFIEKEFIPKIRDYNLQLRNLSNKINICNDALTKFQSIADTASVAAAKASEAMEGEYAFIKQLYKSDTQDYDGNPETLSKTGANPDYVIVTTDNNNVKICKIKQTGVIPTSILVFTALDAAKTFYNALYNSDAETTKEKIKVTQNSTTQKWIAQIIKIENNTSTPTLVGDQYATKELAQNAAINYFLNNIISKGYLKKDNYQVVIDPKTGFASGLNNIDANATALFLVYNYSLDLYHKTLGDQWKIEFQEQTNKYQRYLNVIEKINGERDEDGNLIDSSNGGILQDLQSEYDDILADKNKLLEKFERYLGPAVREGTWTPEDEYAKYGNRKQYTGKLEVRTKFTDDVSLGWDVNTFEGEYKNYYEIFTSNSETGNKVYYPCIKLIGTGSQAANSNYNVWEKIGNYIKENPKCNLQDIGFIFDEQENDQLPSSYKYPHIFRIGSESRVVFLQDRTEQDSSIIPVLMLINADSYCSLQQIDKTNSGVVPSQTEILSQLNGIIGILTTDGNGNYITTKICEVQVDSWIINNNLKNYDVIYPRIKIPYDTFLSNTTDNSLYLNDTELTSFEDYNISWRYDIYNSEEQNQNYIYDDLNFWEEYDEKDLTKIKYTAYVTINPETIIKNNVEFGTYQLFYKLSNTGLAIYLDAIKVMKENSIPKVTYNITPIIFKPKFMEELYDRIHEIIHINDFELKFENVQGYISSVSLNLDSPQDDSIEVKNYTNKFEDMFSSIVAATAAVQKNSGALSVSAQAFVSTGAIGEQTLQKSLDDATISLNLDNSNFVINDSGIKAYSEEGIVYYSPKGIFTATDKNDDGEWDWNTSILPSGISANAIKTGQLDTNLIRIYSGDDLRFQINSEGLFAYKSWFDKIAESDLGDIGLTTEQQNKIKLQNGIDPAQYLQINDDGLFLIAAKGAYLIGDNTIVQLEQDIKRVEISWDGLILRNNEGTATFFAEPDTGNLNITGNLRIDSGTTSAELTNEKLRFGPFQLKRINTYGEALSFIYSK